VGYLKLGIYINILRNPLESICILKRMTRRSTAQIRPKLQIVSLIPDPGSKEEEYSLVTPITPKHLLGVEVSYNCIIK